MIQPDKFFENPFSDSRITDTRLYNFGSDVINRLTAANTDNQYTAIIDQLTGPFTTLGNQLSGVDTALNRQKGKTDAVDRVIEEFSKTLGIEEGIIAKAAGGKGSAIYLEFFPHGLSEYSNATKTTMPLLVQRIYNAATANSALLGETLTAELQAFKEAWADARNTQQQQMGTVEDTRTGRDNTRIEAELALCYAVHSIALMFLGNVQACMQFFDFSLLFVQTHKKHLKLSGSISMQEVKELLNHSFTDSFDFVIRNTSVNADMVVYTGATSAEQPNGQSKEIKSGRALHVKPGAIGNIGNTFLLIKNISDVNEASYEAEISGPGIE